VNLSTPRCELYDRGNDSREWAPDVLARHPTDREEVAAGARDNLEGEFGEYSRRINDLRWPRADEVATREARLTI